MSKILNSIINAQENELSNRDTITLKYVDFLHPTGERVKYVQKKKNKKQMERVLLKYREVEYVYQADTPEKTVVTKGWEVVEEVLVEKEQLLNGVPQPILVEKVTRVIKKKKNE
jgi:hypothetical protein